MPYAIFCRSTPVVEVSVSYAALCKRTPAVKVSVPYATLCGPTIVVEVNVSYPTLQTNTRTWLAKKVSQLVSALSLVNHKGLCQGSRQTSLCLLLILHTSHQTTNSLKSTKSALTQICRKRSLPTNTWTRLAKKVSVCH